MSVSVAQRCCWPASHKFPSAKATPNDQEKKKKKKKEAYLLELELAEDLEVHALELLVDLASVVLQEILECVGDELQLKSLWNGVE